MKHSPSFRSTVLWTVTCLLQLIDARPSPNSNEKPHVKRAFGTLQGNQTFDYVIVGGGTAGLTIAARLAASRQYSVAVIEAGNLYEDAGNYSTVPGYDALFVGTDPSNVFPETDWGFVTVPQKGAADRRMHYARGKTLGGSSARNYMYYHRPTAGSMDKWASEVGDSSFVFNNFLQYFGKSVKYNAPALQSPNTTFDEDTAVFLSNGGPVQVSYGNYIDPFGTWVLPALRSLGQLATRGFQRGVLIGSDYTLMTIDPSKGFTRSSSQTAFFQPDSAVASYTVFNNTLAQKVTFSNGTATAVIVTPAAGDTQGQSVIKAKKEIIVSAGAFQSPQLLMVSGIGPRKLLESVGVTVIKDLPGVGQNLWDQPYFGSAFRVNVLTASASLQFPAVAAQAAEAWQSKGAGPLSMGGVAVLGFEKLPEPYRSKLSSTTLNALEQNFPDDWPELEWLPISAYAGYQRNLATEDPMDGNNYATLSTCLVAPLSRGTVSISSASMSDPPLIDPNWLSDPADQEMAIAAFKRQREIWSKMSNLTIGEEAFPGTKVQSDADILAWIQKALAPIWHPAATCKMGKASDSMAVIDTSAKVFGVKGLRVVDASSFPFLPPGHPQATIYALAEKMADDILGGNSASSGAVTST